VSIPIIICQAGGANNGSDGTLIRRQDAGRLCMVVAHCRGSPQARLV